MSRFPRPWEPPRTVRQKPAPKPVATETSSDRFRLTRWNREPSNPGCSPPLSSLNLVDRVHRDGPTADYAVSTPATGPGKDLSAEACPEPVDDSGDGS